MYKRNFSHYPNVFLGDASGLTDIWFRSGFFWSKVNDTRNNDVVISSLKKTGSGAKMIGSGKRKWNYDMYEYVVNHKCTSNVGKFILINFVLFGHIAIIMCPFLFYCQGLVLWKCSCITLSMGIFCFSSNFHFIYFLIRIMTSSECQWDVSALTPSSLSLSLGPTTNFTIILLVFFFMFFSSLTVRICFKNTYKKTLCRYFMYFFFF